MAKVKFVVDSAAQEWHVLINYKDGAKFTPLFSSPTKDVEIDLAAGEYLTRIAVRGPVDDTATLTITSPGQAKPKVMKATVTSGFNGAHRDSTLVVA